MKRALVSAATAALVLALAACGGGGGAGGSGVLAPHPGNASTASVPQQLLVKNWGGGAMNGATYVGTVSGASLDATVLVHQQNAQALVQYAQMVSDPSSPFFHQFLTPDEIAQRFGATQADYQAAATYFENDGLSVTGWNQRMVLHVAGTQANMEKAFGTTFGLYQRDGQEFIAPMSQPHFSQVLPIDQVGDIVRFRAKHTYLIPAPRVGAGFASGFSPQTVAAAFDYIGAFKAGYSGSGITIGIIGTGPIDAGGSGSGDYDLDALLAATGNPPAAHVNEVAVNNGGVQGGLNKIGNPTFPYSNGFATPPPVTAPCNGSLPACNPEDGEAQLDTQQAATLAPSATVDFYLAYNASDCTGVTYPNACPTSGATAGAPMIGISESDPEIQQAINDDVADVISMSFGLGESQAFSCYNCTGSTQTPYVGSYSQLEFAELASEGIAVFASSGDNGSANCFSGTSNTYLPQQCVSYPAGDPSVTSVGGITTNINGLGQPTAPWLAWGISTMDSGGYGASEGSGGGTSTLIPASDVPWQQSAVSGLSMREQPDVSLDGDPSTGVAMVENAAPLGSGGVSGIGGTSVAAPEMAAMWADLLSACLAHQTLGACASGSAGPHGGWRLGNAAPYLYAIYKGTYYKTGGWTTPTLAYTNVFYDIVYGDNQMANPNGNIATPIPGFAAGTGYDEVSGIGVPFAGHLIESLTGLTGIP